MGNLTYESLVLSTINKLVVFWLPLSWLQCCDIFFSVKEFIDIWADYWNMDDEFPEYDKSIHEIGIDYLFKAIDCCQNRLQTYKPTSDNDDDSDNDNHEDNDNKNADDEKDNINMNTIIATEKSLFVELNEIIVEFVKILKIIEPCLRKMNNFIAFYESMYHSEKKRRDVHHHLRRKFQNKYGHHSWRHRSKMPKLLEGIDKQITFIPDTDNIGKYNQEFSKLQLFITNGIWPKYKHEYKTKYNPNTLKQRQSTRRRRVLRKQEKTKKFLWKHLSEAQRARKMKKMQDREREKEKERKIFNSKPLTMTVDEIFSRLNIQLSSLFLLGDDKETDTSRLGRYLNEKESKKLQMDKLDKDSYSGRSSYNIYNIQCLYQHETQYSQILHSRYLSYRQKQAIKESKYMQNLKSKKNSKFKNNKNKKKSKAKFKVRKGTLSGNLDKSVTDEDIIIDFDTWRGSSGTNKTTVAAGTPERNHHYYHTNSGVLVLDYDIELYRKQLNYPKFYSIDYDYVEKQFINSCIDFVSRLRTQVAVQSQTVEVSNNMNGNRVYSSRNVSFVERNSFRDIYSPLYEYYHDCESFAIWRGRRHNGDRNNINRPGLDRYELYLPTAMQRKPTMNALGYGNRAYLARPTGMAMAAPVRIHHTPPNTRFARARSGSGGFGRGRRGGNDDEKKSFNADEYWGPQDQPTILQYNLDRMYDLRLNKNVEQWYKNGKYMLYRLLNNVDIGSSGGNTGKELFIDFCHFDIYYNRLKILQDIKNNYNSNQLKEKNGKNIDNIDNIGQDVFEKYVWIAINDISRCCKDILWRHGWVEQKSSRSHQQVSTGKQWTSESCHKWDPLFHNQYWPRPHVTGI